MSLLLANIQYEGNCGGKKLKFDYSFCFSHKLCWKIKVLRSPQKKNYKAHYQLSIQELSHLNEFYQFHSKTKIISCVYLRGSFAEMVRIFLGTEATPIPIEKLSCIERFALSIESNMDRRWSTHIPYNEFERSLSWILRISQKNAYFHFLQMMEKCTKQKNLQNRPIQICEIRKK